MKQIPNIFTLINLFLGVVAIILALQTNSIFIYVDDQFRSNFNIPEKLALASFMIMGAAVVDFLDGFVARLLNATSELGKQLDSLSDVVSFGVAPAVIVYQMLRLSFAREEGGLEVSMAMLLPAILIACAAAYRLGRFNLSTGQQYVFRGVPVPAVGLLIASFPLIMHYNTFQQVNGILLNRWFLYGVILLVSWLMISRLSILSLKFTPGGVAANWPIFLLVLIAVVAAVFLKWLAVPVVFLFYIVFSFIISQKPTK